MLYISKIKYPKRWNMDAEMEVYTVTNSGGNLKFTKESKPLVKYYFDYYGMENKRWFKYLVHYDREHFDSTENGFEYRDVYLKYSNPKWRSGVVRMKRLRHVKGADGKYRLIYERVL